MPDQQEFRQHLRRLAVSAVQVLLEQVMREELEQYIGASWGECTPTRRGYRNGSYSRDLVTPTGRIEDLKVPSASAVSRLTQTLTEQYEAWRERRLLPHYRIIYAGRSSISRCGTEPKPMRR